MLQRVMTQAMQQQSEGQGSAPSAAAPPALKLNMNKFKTGSS